MTKLHAFCTTLAAMMLLLTAGCEPADSQKTKSVALFDGKTLDGWTVIGCEAVVDNGEILIQSGNGLVQTEGQYGNFVLEFECLALSEDKWDSGVYFRYNSVPENRPWPARYQVNLRQGMEGNVASISQAASQGLYTPGRWNHFKLTVNGRNVALEMNGQPAWAVDGLNDPPTGYIALQAEVPGGGQWRFRNITIIKLD